VSRANDVGGVEGHGEIQVDDDAFHEDWELHVFALNTLLLRKGLYTDDELRDAIERIPHADFVATRYYERRVRAMTTLLRDKGVIP
jgi:nitrile hydratase